MKELPQRRIGSHICCFVVFTCLFVLSARGQGTGGVEGTVVEGTSEEPLVGVNVVLQETGRGGTTGADGSFEIQQIEPGLYTLQTSFVGFRTHTRSIRVREGEQVHVSVQLLRRRTRLDEVVVEGRSTNLVNVADAASQGWTGLAQLENRPLLRTGEVMETVPGMIATQHSGSGKANQYFLRGFNLDHGTDFSASVEGVPINLRTHAHGQGYLDLNFLIPELIDRIQFEKGPYDADDGDFATSGNARIQLRDSLDSSIAKMEVGLNEHYSGLFVNSHSVEGANLLYGVNARYYNGPWKNPENASMVSSVLKYSSGTNAEGYTVGALGYYNKWTASDQIPRRAIQQDRISRFGTLDPTDGGRTTRLTAFGNWRNTGPDQGRTSVSAYGVYYRLNLFSNFTYYLNHPSQGDQFEQADERMYGGASASHEWSINWFGRTLTNRVGGELRHDEIFEVALYQTDDRRRFRTIRDDAVSETSLGLYVENEIAWHEKVRSIIGYRGDVYRFGVTSSIAENSGVQTDFIGSPKVNLILGPWYDTEYYLNVGSGFHSNDARGTTIQLDPQSKTPVDAVDPLVPSRGAEVGARTAVLSSLQSTVSLWYLSSDSELVFVGDGGSTEPSRASERYGIEWANYYQPLDWFTLNVDIAFTESHFTEQAPAGEEIPNSIDRVISGGITTNLAKGLQSSVRVRHFGPRPLTPSGTPKSDPSTLLNLKLSYRYERVEVEANVLNVLDARDPDISYYYRSRLQGEPVGGTEGVHFHPVIPRTARLSMAVHF